jgi:hypothetical protein
LEELECQFLQEPHGITSPKKAVFFIVTAIKTLNVTRNTFLSILAYGLYSCAHTRLYKRKQEITVTVKDIPFLGILSRVLYCYAAH